MKDISYRFHSWLIKSLIKWLKIKNIELFKKIYRMSTILIGLAVDLLAIWLIGSLYQTIQELILSVLIVGVMKINNGEHSNGWLECFIFTVVIFTIYCVMVSQFSTGWLFNLELIVFIGLLSKKTIVLHKDMNTKFESIKNKIKRWFFER